MPRLLCAAFVLIALAGCGKKVRAYHGSAKNLRAVIATESLETCTPTMRHALTEWARDRDEAWALPTKIIKALRKASGYAERLKILKGP